SLMPLYRQLVRGYEVVYQPLNGHLDPTHRLADDWNLRHGIYEGVPDTHRPHIDFNRRNNKPTNPMRKDAGGHIPLDNAETFGEDFDPGAHSAAIRDALRRLRADPVWEDHFLHLQRDKALHFWHDEAYEEVRARVLAQRRNPSEETRQAHREATLRRY